MAWEWVGPTATGLVGIVGIASTFWTGKQQRENQLEVIQNQHRANLALDERKLKMQLFARFLSTVDQFLYDYRVRDTISKGLERLDLKVDEVFNDPSIEHKLEGVSPGITTDTKAIEQAKEALLRETKDSSRNKLLKDLQERVRHFGIDEYGQTDSTIFVRDIKVLCSEVELVSSNTVGTLTRATTKKIVDYCSPSSKLSDDDINSTVKSLAAAMKEELYSDSEKS